MSRAAFWLGGAFLLAGTAALAQPAARPEKTVEGGGEHWRLQTSQGPVHVWRPLGHRFASMGTVIYLHGYFIDADGAWKDHRLAEQFAASRQNALFIVPEAPQGDEQAVSWSNLDDLLVTVGRALRLRLPPGPLVAAAHSGAYRAILCWLPNARLRHVILLDGMYRDEETFLNWLKQGGRRLILVGADTYEKSVKMATDYPVAVLRDGLPEKFEKFTASEFAEDLVLIKSQYDHMAMVTEGKVLPLVLRLTPLRALVEAPAHQP